MMPHAYNSSTGETGAGVQGQPQIHGEFTTSLNKTLSQRERKKRKETLCTASDHG